MTDARPCAESRDLRECPRELPQGRQRCDAHVEGEGSPSGGRSRPLKAMPFGCAAPREGKPAPRYHRAPRGRVPSLYCRQRGRAETPPKGGLAWARFPPGWPSRRGSLGEVCGGVTPCPLSSRPAPTPARHVTEVRGMRTATAALNFPNGSAGGAAAVGGGEAPWLCPGLLGMGACLPSFL